MHNRLSKLLWLLPGLSSGAFISVFVVLLAGVWPVPLTARSASQASPSLLYNVYLPLVFSPWQPVRRVNVPQFENSIQFEQTSILWFGKVNSQDNYTDVRMGYNSNEFYIHVAIADRLLWYDLSPSAGDLTKWDAVSIYLNLDGNTSDSPGPRSYLFNGQLNWWEPRADFQAAYRWSGSNWAPVSLPFTTTTDWKGYPQPNDSQDDRGWWIQFDIPFASLGLSGPPPQGAVWGLAFVTHDRDDSAGTLIPDKVWPEEMRTGSPKTWGQLHFGLPHYSPPAGVTPGQTYTIRHKLNGANVVDGMVGGSSICGEGLDFWTEWGQKNYAGAEQVNVQNEYDISDWPCFSKFYITFPLNSLPANQTVISATLALYSVGNAGGGQWGPPSDSFIQILTVNEDWDKSTLTWNNAPLAYENMGGSWVLPIVEWPGWPGVPRYWDLSNVVNQAYTTGKPLRLVLYSADGNYNTGRYFSSSDVGDWNAIGRPTLKVVLGTP
jgi:hypothetical protein